MLPETDDNGSPILMMRGGLEEPGKYKIEDLFKVSQNHDKKNHKETQFH
jgi:hypothetical protein